jgi:hypothetical protein
MQQHRTMLDHTKSYLERSSSKVSALFALPTKTSPDIKETAQRFSYCDPELVSSCEVALTFTSDNTCPTSMTTTLRGGSLLSNLLDERRASHLSEQRNIGNTEKWEGDQC